MDTLDKIKNTHADVCVTIIMNTHQTRPAIQQDMLTLKNLTREAEERILSLCDPKTAESILHQLKNTINSIDFSRNDKSLILFVCHEFGQYLTLPVSVKNRVVIDKTFATRDVYRAMHETAAYYVLALSRKKARLIKAINNQGEELKIQPFPLYNEGFNEQKAKLSPDEIQESLIEEFFNNVDKALWEVIRNSDLPVVIASEIRNYNIFLKLSRHKKKIIGRVPLLHEDAKTHQIVAEAWQLVKKNLEDQTRKQLSRLEKAINNQNLLTDYTEVWNAIQQGRGRTLFVKKGFHQPAVLLNGHVALVEKVMKDAPSVIEDIIDEMIEKMIEQQGEVVFIDGDDLDRFNGIALIVKS
ncbi:MAG TPA: hypothetical protein PK028_07885 [Bacteroidales bacterium]|jgi:hypothetical protein|nr:hypothetical protein [Bacteroidales bacterium]MDI9573737.1 hypothetical protein [Bacteroidota bacterium]OQC58869.1 MAG: hypothetical protein BWX51_01838 [Bacteroidetes bacterium ADurb.Bin012]MBP9512635.1 hypothetical protein [Bacteroidales bacterium]MBP9588850.1 hypothetical protein [Bacteroidales bacterium]